MKTSTILLLLTLCVPLTTSFGQDFPAGQGGRRGGVGGAGGAGGGGFGGRGGFGPAPAFAAAQPQSSGDVAEDKLPSFDLDFPGGTPGQLVRAIQTASGAALNVIIPEEYAETHISKFTMKGVNVAHLFEALSSSSRKSVPVVTSINQGPSGRSPSYSYQTESFGFRTENPLTVNSVWYFYMDAPHPPPLPQAGDKICRFYQLAPYLDREYRVEDITTAVQTGWEMLGIKTKPTLNFHKETKLLIAVGESDQLDVIDAVLSHLTYTGQPRENLPKPASVQTPPR